MFDDLRQKSAEQAEFLNAEVDREAEPADAQSVAPLRPARRLPSFSLALTPLQRFFLALMLFLNVAVLGLFALVVFEKIVLPFF
jgi:hypothetical protein